MGMLILIWIYSLYVSKIQKEEIIQDILIKNIDWESPLQDEVSYVIGNEIELYYILNAQDWYRVTIDLKKLTSEFDISSVSIWGKSITISELISVNISENTALKIVWITKNNTDKWAEYLKNLISIYSEPSDKISWNNNNSINTSTNTENTIITDEQISIFDDNDSDFEINISEENILDNNIAIEEPQIDLKWEDYEYILNQTEFNSNINNLLEISGNNINNIQYINIGSFSFSPTFKDNKAYFLIEKDTFNSWNYFSLIQLKQWDIIVLDQEIIFEYFNSPINIANITPNIVNNSKSSSIVLQWNGFDNIISIQLNNNIVLQQTSFQVINDKVLSIRIDPSLTIWTYSFNFMTPTGIIEIDNMSFSIIQ